MHVILAALAEEEAKRNYHGNTTAAYSTLAPLAEPFADAGEETLESLEAGWGGAFLYRCLCRAGVSLPVRYPDARVHHSFARPAAWEEFARLPKIGLWRQEGTPEIGDLVFWTGKDGGVLYVGILLRMDDERMELAVGDYHNHSAVVERLLTQPIRGYVRF